MHRRPGPLWVLGDPSVACRRAPAATLGGVELRVLGGIEVVADGNLVPLGGSKPRLLTAVLAAHRRQVVSIDTLADALWGDAPPPTAKATLQTHVSKLRRLFHGSSGVDLVNRPPGYVLEIDRQLVDADRFEAGLLDGRAVGDLDPGAAIERLDAALGLWRGPAFAEFADTPSVQAEAIRLEELRLVAVEERIDARLDVGRHAAAIGELEAMVREHPLRERPWRQLMLALHRSGRQTEALRTAQRVREQLRDEAGLEPSSALQALEQAIAGDDPSLQPPAVAPGTVAAAPGSRWPRQALPDPVTELVGRSAELERLVESLFSARVVTLTGTGGIGKSRLAEEVARRDAHQFRDGVAAVQLAAVRDEGAVLAAVAAVLGVEQRPERSLERSVIEVLGPLDMLLLVDNCEHLIGAVSELVREVVRWCPGVRVLATSREPIGMPGEIVWPLAPLTVPADGAAFDEIVSAPAVQVFTARAREASPVFELNERTASAVAELCAALDGLPLALELAAARMGSMSPRQLADRLNERFELLASRHAADPRHRTLVGVVEWSYDLLSPSEQQLFDRLSVFAGGFDLDTVEQACAHGDIRRRDVAPLVGALVDRSLVVVEHADARVRYRQLETLRQFGAERLERRPDAVQVRAGHATAFVDIAEQASLAMETDEEGSWVDRLDRDFANLRAAVRSATSDGDVDTVLRLTVASRHFAFRRMRYEVVGWAEDAVTLEGSADHPLRPTALGIVGYGGFVRGDLDRAIELGQEAIAEQTRLAVPSTGLAERVLLNAVFYRGDRVQAMRWADGMLAGARATGVAGRVAHALYMYSVARSSLGEPELAIELAAEAQREAERSGSPTALARAAYAAALPLGSTQPERSLVLLDSAAELAGSVGGRWMRAFALTQAMWLRAQQGDIETALRGYRKVVETWYRGGDWANQWLSLRQLAGVLASAGLDEDAALLFGAVSAAGATTALPFAPADADTLHRVSNGVKQRLGGDEMVDAHGRGRRMRDEAVVAHALSAIDRLIG
jgi:predicted ATPase/DNA-binding SARP family transcriptional activator